MALVKRSGGARAGLERFKQKRPEDDHLPIVGESLVGESKTPVPPTPAPQLSRAEQIVMDEKARADAPAPPPNAWARALAWLHREW